MSIRVVLVEDMLALRSAVAELLAAQGDFRVVAEFGTEAEAIQWFADHPSDWDLAVIDLVLEHGTGMGVVARARKSSRHGHIVVYSDYATHGIRRHCLNLGANATFTKHEDVQAFARHCRDWAEGQATTPTASPM